MTQLLLMKAYNLKKEKKETCLNSAFINLEPMHAMCYQEPC